MLGYDVYFWERSPAGTSHDLKLAFDLAAKCALRGRIRRSVSYLKRNRIYESAQKRFHIIQDISTDISILVYGSDTIWNFADNYFFNRSRHYLGLDVTSKRKMTYAVSAGNTTYEVFTSVSDVSRALDAYDALGVRDLHTGNIIRSLSAKVITYVCDPTFLLNPEYYKAFRIREIKERYLLIYYFGSIDNITKNWILKYADKQKMKIYNLGLIGDMNWCKTINTTPSSFITYFMQADFIFTNTFHGAAFSIIFNKEFIAYTYDKQKVIGLLHDFSLNDRICSNVVDIERVLQKKIDYENVNKILDDARGNSILFLKKHLEAFGEI